MPNDGAAAHADSTQTSTSPSSTFPSPTSPSSIGGSKFALSSQRLNELVKLLRDCGIETILKLPKIVIIGNQSAGKSSLIEAISQVKMPRAMGTCTRCPMEVVLTSATHGKPWHCKVSLRIDNQDRIGQPPGIFEFGETETKDEVTGLLRRAQLAILNPRMEFDHFVELNDEQCENHEREISFSRNTVVLEISGAGVDVTFIDLPGIISSTEKVASPSTIANFKEEEAHFIGLIKDLVEFYVSQEECLVLATVSMKGTSPYLVDLTGKTTSIVSHLSGLQGTTTNKDCAPSVIIRFFTTSAV